MLGDLGTMTEHLLSARLCPRSGTSGMTGTQPACGELTAREGTQSLTPCS